MPDDRVARTGAALVRRSVSMAGSRCAAEFDCISEGEKRQADNEEQRGADAKLRRFGESTRRCNARDYSRDDEQNG